MSNTEPHGSTRRDILKASAAAAFTTMIFPKMVRGANDKLAVGFIGTGTMGQGNVHYALETDKVQAVAMCDVYQPNLEKAIGVAQKFGQSPKGFKDFREVLADKSIDAVCIATPDHWHAYIEVEACKAGRMSTSKSQLARGWKKARRWSRPRASTSAWCRAERCSALAATSRKRPN